MYKKIPDYIKFFAMTLVAVILTANITADRTADRTAEKTIKDFKSEHLIMLVPERDVEGIKTYGDKNNTR